LNQGATINKERVENIKKAHSQIVERDNKGRVSRVKFEALKYDLTNLFEDVPAFNEPVPIFGQLTDFVP